VKPPCHPRARIVFYKFNTVGELTGDYTYLGGGRTMDAQPVALDPGVTKGDRIGVIGTGDPEAQGRRRRSLPSDVGGVYSSNFDGSVVRLKPLEARYTDLRLMVWSSAMNSATTP